MHKITCKIDTDGDIQWIYWTRSLPCSHNNNGPASKFASSTNVWAVNGKYHRLDGPAIEWSDGDKEWWINDNSYDDEFEYWLAVQNYTNLN